MNDNASADRHRTTTAVDVCPDVLFRELLGEAVLLDLRSQRYYGLDAIGTKLWHLISDKGEIESVVHVMLEEYDVEEARLRRDLDAFLRQLAEVGLVEIAQGGPAVARESTCEPGTP